MNEVDQLPNGSGGPSKSQKGVVEEVISKRLKALTKKIIRIRTYGDQSPSSLNNDQRAAMASLPSLEAVARELEDLIKPGGPVEIAELTQAGVLRETRETAAAEAVSIAQLQVSNYSELLSKRISQFLQLYSLLHPARASDLQHLVDGNLDLPSHLREVMTPSDILRVGRMHDDLKAGGDVGKLVLQHLAGNPDHLDTEDKHVLELLDLVSQAYEISVPSSENAAPASESVNVEVDPSVQPQFGSITGPSEVETERQPRSRQPTDYSMHTKMSDDGIPLGASAGNMGGMAREPPPPPVRQRTPTPPPPPPPVVIAPPIVPPPINFLQEDELVHKLKPDVEQQTQLEPAAEINKQPPPPQVDWTVDDEDDQTPIFGTRPPSSVQLAPTPPTKDEAQDQEITQLDEAMTSKPLPDLPVVSNKVPASDTASNETPAKSTSKQPRQAVASGSKRGKGKATNGGSKTESKPAFPAIIARGSSQKVIDADGFEQVIKKQAQSQSQGQGQGGRGGMTRGKSDRGRGGGQGQGQGQGRGQGQTGRGDRGRGLPRNTSKSQESKEPDGASLPAKPVNKPSVFKSDVVKQ